VERIAKDFCRAHNTNAIFSTVLIQLSILQTNTTTNRTSLIPNHRLRVVILGAGFGGLAAARALGNAPIDLTVIDQHNHHLFQPLLYQVATAAISPQEIAQPIRGILRRQKNTEVVLARVKSVDTSAREVLLADGGSITYDYLVFAPGSQVSYFGHNEWAQFAPGLKTLADALNIRRRILLAFEKAEREKSSSERAKLLTFVIIGGGPTGVELAGAIAEISRRALVEDFRHIDSRESRVLLIEAAPRVLPTMAPELSDEARRSLERLGVEVRTSTAVSALEKQRVHLGQESLCAATILWTAGVRPVPLAASLGVPLDRAGRVPVQPDLSIADHPEVFVIGDVAAFVHQGGRLLPGVSPVAVQQGRHAASCIEADLRGAPRKPFWYKDRGEMATIGRAEAVVDLHWLRLSKFPGWLTWLTVHLFFLIGFENRLVVMIRWAWSYLTFSRSARLITGPVESPDDEP
jgi:NADH:ubiquinone reductase (H+-translocating)